MERNIFSASPFIYTNWLKNQTDLFYKLLSEISDKLVNTCSCIPPHLLTPEKILNIAKEFLTVFRI